MMEQEAALLIEFLDLPTVHVTDGQRLKVH